MVEDIKPVTYLKRSSSELLKKLGESRRPVIITQNGEAKAVVLDVDSYESMRNTMLLLKLIAQGEEDIRAGRTVSQEKTFARARKRLTHP